MSKRQHAYEFPLDPTLLDELSAWRDKAPEPAHPLRVAQYAARLAHAARGFGLRLARRPHGSQFGGCAR
ncbi:MAG: hypothetical protein HY749_00325 [Gammaproteobacteria bacterium]|nr:hypothetical protein [Gammaproteobacteria bacterium]MBI5617115.1 hypothetical protein [Gammaproteobacteria bacterium]